MNKQIRWIVRIYWIVEIELCSSEWSMYAVRCECILLPNIHPQLLCMPARLLRRRLHRNRLLRLYEKQAADMASGDIDHRLSDRCSSHLVLVSGVPPELYCEPKRSWPDHGATGWWARVWIPSTDALSAVAAGHPHVRVRKQQPEGAWACRSGVEFFSLIFFLALVLYNITAAVFFSGCGTIVFLCAYLSFYK